jgi:glycyl-tRNA synthetase
MYGGMLNTQNIWHSPIHLLLLDFDKGAVGRRYRRQDEAGTPYCITVDTQTFEDQTVTVRDRDSMKQERVMTDQLSVYLNQKLISFE